MWYKYKRETIRAPKKLPADITFDEVYRLLTLLGYTPSTKGKTSGSRVSFASSGKIPIMLHRPHPQKELKAYALKQLLEELTINGDIEI